MKWFVSFLLVVCLAGFGWAQPSLQQEVNPDGTAVPFGKPVELILTLSHSPDLKTPAPDTLEIPGVHMLDRFRVESPSGADKDVTQYHFVFTRLEPGKFEVPSIEIAGAASLPVTVDFSGSTPLDSDEPGEIRGPKAVVELSTRDFWTNAAKWTLSSLIVLALLAWLSSYLGLLDRLRSPKGRALSRLKRLKKTESGAPEMLLGCVEVLRRYLHEAYGFATAEATSREILNQMTMDNRCRGFKESVAGLLESGDNVKFAQKSLTASQAQDHYENLVSTLKIEPKVKS